MALPNHRSGAFSAPDFAVDRAAGVHIGRNRPSCAAPACASLGAAAEVGAQGATGYGTSLGNGGAGCGGGAQREPGIEPLSRASATAHPMSADAGRQRGDRTDGGGRFDA